MGFDLSLMQPVLKSVFGFDDFRELQKPIVESVMNNNDTLAILKTSGGKSLCFQMPAIYRGGTTLVVSPLISLMKDQVDALVAKGVSAAYVNSSISFEETTARYDALSKGKYSLFYVSPERFKDQAFVNALVRSPVSMFTIDESHCASQWGHDFRPSYANLGNALDAVEGYLRRKVQRVALTATANTKVQADIVKMLGLRTPDLHIQDFDRENLSYAVVMAKKSDRTPEILQALQEHRSDGCTIIYCVTVKEVEKLHQKLSNSGVDCNRYHGRLETEEKNEIQDLFLAGEIKCLIATSAFGMGVDKSDVRLVIHAQMPGSLEAWYQEAGRAGRDGLPAKAILFYHDADKSIHRFFIGQGAPEACKIAPIKDMIRKILFLGPSSLDARLIAMHCTQQLAVIHTVMPDSGIRLVELTRNDVIATITLLKNQGEIEEREGLFALGNWQESNEYIWVDEVKRHNWLKFNAMCSWCETNLCRRWQILRYFDERKPHYYCGNCDNCERRAMAVVQTNLVEKAVRPSTLMAMASALDSISKAHQARWIHILLGTMEVKLLTDAETEVSGRFQWHAVGDLKRWERSLIENGIVDESHKLSEKGVDWINGRVDVPVVKPQSQTSGSKSTAIVPAPLVELRVKILRAWRKSTAYRADLSEMQIMTEPQMHKIAGLELITPETIAKAGFTEKWLANHSSNILKSFEKAERLNDCVH